MRKRGMFPKFKSKSESGAHKSQECLYYSWWSKWVPSSRVYCVLFSSISFPSSFCPAKRMDLQKCLFISTRYILSQDMKKNLCFMRVSLSFIVTRLILFVCSFFSRSRRRWHSCLLSFFPVSLFMSSFTGIKSSFPFSFSVYFRLWKNIAVSPHIFTPFIFSSSAVLFSKDIDSRFKEKVVSKKWLEKTATEINDIFNDRRTWRGETENLRFLVGSHFVPVASSFTDDEVNINWRASSLDIKRWKCFLEWSLCRELIFLSSSWFRKRGVHLKEKDHSIPHLHAGHTREETEATESTTE